MWDRKELKARGKTAFQANYWPCVGAAAILMFASGAGSVASGSRVTNTQDLSNQLQGLNQEQLAVVVAVVLGAVGLAMLVGVVVNIFVFKPLEVGVRRFFAVNSQEPAAMNELTYGFRNGYMHTVGTLFLRSLFLTLWSCLLFIPGIVKAYSYRMVPYIVADRPELSAKETITLSRKMMDGQKMNAFLLDLSFLGWILLSVISLGLVGIFFVNPYVAATDAELYHTLSENF